MIKRLTPTFILLASIFALAFLLRVYGVNFPRYHWDENLNFSSVFYASFNQLRLQTYVHGSLLAYLILLLWNSALVLRGVMPTTAHLLVAFFSDENSFALMARELLVVVGTANAGVVYFLGKRLYNSRVGLLAAFFLALSFLHASESHYARGHILSAFFVTLSLYFSAAIVNRSRQSDYLLAGIFVGLATAAQYSGILAIMSILVAHLARWRGHLGERWRALLISADAAGMAFFLVTPYSLIQFSFFAGEMKWFLAEIASHAWVNSEGQPVWLFYLTEHLRNGMGMPLEIIALFGIAYAMYRRQSQDWVLLSFPILLFITFAKGENFARYALPLLPFLAIAAARVVDDLARAAASFFDERWIRVALFPIAIAIMIPSALDIARYDYLLTQPDTRQIALNWIFANVPEDATMLVEGAGVLGPPVPASRNQLDEQIAVEPKEGVGYLYLQAMRATQRAPRGYRVDTVFRLDQLHDSGILIGTLSSAQDYAARGIDYLVTVDWMRHDEADQYAPAFQTSLDALYEPIQTFMPSISFRFDPYAWRLDYDALARVVVGQPGIGGPTLIVYRRRGAK